MKIINLTPLVAVLAIPAGLDAAPEMRDAATHTQIVPVYRQAVQEDPMLKQQPAKGPDPSTANPPPSLMDGSDILCFNGTVTLVPKRAILQSPKGIADRFKYQPGSKLLTWGEFYALNRGWITTVEVNREQAAGTEPLSDQTQTIMSKSGNLIVATYQAGPISVLPPKVPAETTVETTQP